MRPVLTVLLVSWLVACAGVGNLFESAQMKRAKEFISVGEFESARTELRVQLHNTPEDPEAKALLLFMRLAEVKDGSGDAILGCLVPATTPPAASTAAEEAQKQLRLKIRKNELDAGIPTKDWDEYRLILDKAINYGWKVHDFSADNLRPKLVFAFCAAMRNDPTGSSYLVDHLAQDDVRDDAKNLLFLVGEPAIPGLTAVARSPENLAQKAADDALRDLQLAGLIERLSMEHVKRVSPTSVRTDGNTRNQSSGKFLMNLGWKDDNEGLKPLFEAAKLRASLSQASSADSEAPIMIRRVKVGETEVLLATVALPASSNTEDPTAALQPAGINTTFLTQAWSWSGEKWAPLTIDGKPSVSGPDLAVLRVTGPPAPGSDAGADVGPDQLVVSVYRGVESKTQMVNLGWYGTRARTVSASRVDRVFYHLGNGTLERVKATNGDGLEIDPAGNVLPGQVGSEEELEEGGE